MTQKITLDFNNTVTVNGKLYVRFVMAADAGLTKTASIPRQSQRWTAAEDGILRQGRADNQPFHAIAAQLGRTDKATALRWALLSGKRKPAVKEP